MPIKETISHTWVIENFDSVRSNITSQKLFLQSDPSFYVKLGFYPINEKSGWSNYASICLIRSGKIENVNCTISFVDLNEDKKLSSDISCSYDNQSIYSCHYYVRSSFLRDPKNGLLNDNKLKIHCEIRIIDDPNTTTTKQNHSGKSICCENGKVIEDYNSLLESGKFSDAVLVIGEKQFQVHKAILASRSPVFASMFEHECKEKLNNRIELADMVVEVCEELLRYIYTGKITMLKEYALELFIAADKYQLDSLKIICGESLSSTMSIETVSKVLAYADMHNEVELKLKCIGFITENCTEVMATDGWQQLTKARPELLIELYQDIATKYKK